MRLKWIRTLLIASSCIALAGTVALAQETTEEVTMTPWMNSNILGTVSEESETPDLKDDFYQAINHDWLVQAELKPGHVRNSGFDECQDSINEQLMAFMTDESVTGYDAELMRSLYGLFLDWDSRNELGMTPFLPHIQAIEDIDSLDALTAYLTSEEGLYYGNSMYTVGLSVDRQDSDKYGVNIFSNGLLLNDSAEYDELTQVGQIYYWLHQQISNLMFTKLGYSEEEAQQILENSLELDAMLAPAIMTIEDANAGDAIEKTTNSVSYEDLKELSPTFPLPQMMEAFDDADWNSINLSEPDWLEKMNELYTEDNLELFKDHILLSYVEGCASMADEETYRQYQEIINMANGITESSPDEEIAYNFVSGILSNSVSKVFAEQCMSDEIKQDITQLIEEIIAVYRNMLESETWLTEETRKEAINKLDHMVIHAAYPEKWESTDSIQITPKENGGTLYGAIRELMEYNLSKAMSHKNGEVDHEIWELPLAQANAYYNPQDNSINILAGILREPFYKDDMSEEEKMGGIGMVIGHEISHAFDTNGSQYDEKGNLVNWWSEEDFAAFQERAKKLIQYYDAMVVMPDGTGYSGTLVQSEAIADLAGVKCMLEISKEKEAFDYNHFFRKQAELWRSINTSESMYAAIAADEHPLMYLRTNVTLAQFDEFQETYDIIEGDGMYISENERICVW